MKYPLRAHIYFCRTVQVKPGTAPVRTLERGTICGRHLDNRYRVSMANKHEVYVEEKDINGFEDGHSYTSKLPVGSYVLLVGFHPDLPHIVNRLGYIINNYNNEGMFYLYRCNAGHTYRITDDMIERVFDKSESPLPPDDELKKKVAELTSRLEALQTNVSLMRDEIFQLKANPPVTYIYNDHRGRP